MNDGQYVCVYQLVLCRNFLAKIFMISAQHVAGVRNKKPDNQRQYEFSRAKQLLADVQTCLFDLGQKDKL